MKNFLSQLKNKFRAISSEEASAGDDEGEDYVELDTEQQASSKVIVRTFAMQSFEDIKDVLDSLREGRTIALVNIKPLKDKDIVELKRAINKLKKTTDAMEGQIAGFGEDYIIVTPSFAEIYKSKQTSDIHGPEEQATTEETF